MEKAQKVNSGTTFNANGGEIGTTEVAEVAPLEKEEIWFNSETVCPTATSQFSHNLPVPLNNKNTAKNLKLTQVEHACFKECHHKISVVSCQPRTSIKHLRGCCGKMKHFFAPCWVGVEPTVGKSSTCKRLLRRWTSTGHHFRKSRGVISHGASVAE